MSEIRVYDFTGRATEENKTSFENPEQFLKEKFNGGCNFGTENLMRYGVYKLMGWAYDFKPFLKSFLYKQNGEWTEIYAPNKTLLRKSIYGRIDKIVEI